MDAIKNYLDNMFANLPGTPSVLRAKSELGQMMEDKYTELIAEGKSENEAVGSVISEFGNLSELAEALGLEEEIKEQKAEENSNPGRILSTEEAAGYIRMRTKKALYTALGIALCVLSPICPIFLTEVGNNISDIFAPIGMFAIVMVGVGFIIYGSSLKRPWKYIHKEKCTLSMDTTKYVSDEQERFYGSYVAEMIAGIICCASSWMPAAVFDEFTAYGNVLGGSFFFLMVGIGVFLLIHSHIRRGAYRNLLKLNKAGTMKASYKAAEQGKESETMGETIGKEIEKSLDKKEEVKYISPVAEFIMDVYWPTVICLYLCSSFITFKWGLTWIIWPAAGILHRVFSRNLTE